MDSEQLGWFLATSAASIIVTLVIAYFASYKKIVASLVQNVRREIEAEARSGTEQRTVIEREIGNLREELRAVRDDLKEVRKTQAAQMADIAGMASTLKHLERDDPSRRRLS